ncbi:hypothetical protein JAAARDRAFT_74256 [Jaapia argillacea MUCL 33604]|uniref:Uncharacterized protein n=1 Tax=Jaapia argillacea MUCL 33604 TaxID=933084 RepID=A0A067P6E1_9AGAM|nr:hypothetical protein JAAARDRAFT_74256 [Jaapia argillacea MUCL 33604]
MHCWTNTDELSKSSILKHPPSSQVRKNHIPCSPSIPPSKFVPTNSSRSIPVPHRSRHSLSPWSLS